MPAVSPSCCLTCKDLREPARSDWIYRRVRENDGQHGTKERILCVCDPLSRLFCHLWYVDDSPFPLYPIHYHSHQSIPYLLPAAVIYPNRNFLHPHALVDVLASRLPANFGAPLAIVRNWSFAVFYVMAEMWGSVVVRAHLKKSDGRLLLCLFSECPSHGIY
jgi:hypothetical protein